MERHDGYKLLPGGRYSTLCGEDCRKPSVETLVRKRQWFGVSDEAGYQVPCAEHKYKWQVVRQAPGETGHYR